MTVKREEGNTMQDLTQGGEVNAVWRDMETAPHVLKSCGVHMITQQEFCCGTVMNISRVVEELDLYLFGCLVKRLG